MTHFILRWDKSLFFSYSFSLEFISFYLNSKRKNEAILKKTSEIREFSAKNHRMKIPKFIPLAQSQCLGNLSAVRMSHYLLKSAM